MGHVQHFFKTDYTEYSGKNEYSVQPNIRFCKT
jgi:hypothetical protein